MEAVRGFLGGSQGLQDDEEKKKDLLQDAYQAGKEATIVAGGHGKRLEVPAAPHHIEEAEALDWEGMRLPQWW